MATSPPPPPAPQPPFREREYNDSPTTKYLNSVDLYNVTSSRRDSRASNLSNASKNDYYYDKENELYSSRRNERDLKLAPPREDREDYYDLQQQSNHQQQQQTRTQTRGSVSYSSRLSPILSSPTSDVTKNLSF